MTCTQVIDGGFGVDCDEMQVVFHNARHSPNDGLSVYNEVNLSRKVASGERVAGGGAFVPYRYIMAYVRDKLGATATDTSGGSSQESPQESSGSVLVKRKRGTYNCARNKELKAVSTEGVRELVSDVNGALKELWSSMKKVEAPSVGSQQLYLQRQNGKLRVPYDDRVMAILKGRGLGAFYNVFPTPYKFRRFMREKMFDKWF